MKISVYGSGCATCKKLFELVKKAADKEDTVEYVTGDKGMEKILELGALKSPVMAVEDKIAMQGFTPDISKIKEAIKKAKGS